jgi:LemA protein
MVWWATAFAGMALAALVAVTFNDMVTARNRVRAAWADIDVQLQRRHDLVPPLAAIVRGYAAHESAVVQSVTESRARALAAAGVTARGMAEAALGNGLARLLAIQENYPDLKASGNFRDLQNQLVAIEDAVQAARSRYNETVRAYNTLIQQFPEVMLARPFGFRAQEFFQADATAPIRL